MPTLNMKPLDEGYGYPWVNRRLAPPGDLHTLRHSNTCGVHEYRGFAREKRGQCHFRASFTVGLLWVDCCKKGG